MTNPDRQPPRKPDYTDFDQTRALPLIPCGRWQADAVHRFDHQQVIAVLAAIVIRRPLLVRGEPGIGKTQLARAVAQVLRMPLAVMVVNERTEPEDPKWHYDALRRLSDANDPNESLDEKHKRYLSAGPLWWALNRETAETHAGHHSSKPYEGGEKDKRDYANGVVLLIDEIDKAERSVPNSLLDALGNFSFDVPYIDEPVACSGNQSAPLIIITSNNEQELPPAFVRRCLVLDMRLDDQDEETFVSTLAQRGLDRFGSQLDEKTRREVAKQLLKKRIPLREAGETWYPGQAEYLDHLDAWLQLRGASSEVKDEELLLQLGELTYGKQTR